MQSREVHCIILQPKPSVTHPSYLGAILACGTRRNEREYSLPLLLLSPIRGSSNDQHFRQFPFAKRSPLWTHHHKNFGEFAHVPATVLLVMARSEIIEPFSDMHNHMQIQLVQLLRTRLIQPPIQFQTLPIQLQTYLVQTPIQLRSLPVQLRSLPVQL